MPNNQIIAHEDVRFDVYFLVDDTNSMKNYLQSMRQTLDQVLPMTRLMLKGQAEIRIFTYNDFNSGIEDVVRSEYGINSDLNQFVGDLEARGCNKYNNSPGEACKSGFNHILKAIENDINDGQIIKAYVFHYGDDCPHSLFSKNFCQENYQKEIEYIRSIDGMFDWKQLCQKYQELEISVFSLVSRDRYNLISYYSLMGPVVKLKKSDPETITRATIRILTQILGEKYNYKGKYDKFYLVRCCQDQSSQAVEEMEQAGKMTPVPYYQSPTYQIPQSEEFYGQLTQIQAEFKSSQQYRMLAFRILNYFMCKERVKMLCYNTVLQEIFSLFNTLEHREQYLTLKKKLNDFNHQLSQNEKHSLSKFI